MFFFLRFGHHKQSAQRQLCISDFGVNFSFKCFSSVVSAQGVMTSVYIKQGKRPQKYFLYTV